MSLLTQIEIWVALAGSAFCLLFLIGFLFNYYFKGD